MLELGVRVVISLGVVLGLFWTIARIGSRKVGGRDRSLVRVRSRQALSRGSSLAVVEVGSRVLVVGVSDAGVRLLTELDPFELETDVSDLTELPAEATVLRADAPARPLSRRATRSSGRPARSATRPAARIAPRPATRAADDASALGGSLLAPATWKQAWSAATGTRSYVGTHASVPGSTE
ncbi:flagellar biosynthetic protein FliO [Nocardioides panacis]|uniref:Flagellar biosynthetic protein FliO n=1 Tax=Nocardioides panacis TaxID=2849501 RepID=A0A975SYU8_9ACTN|nr:flagellar biosynthetic protein FliO [Nocardioides panacis]QWZ08500.1 flagellar biosynthetic protein FliO [Nocardioides panacis]